MAAKACSRCEEIVRVDIVEVGNKLQALAIGEKGPEQSYEELRSVEEECRRLKREVDEANELTKALTLESARCSRNARERKRKRSVKENKDTKGHTPCSLDTANVFLQTLLQKNDWEDIKSKAIVWDGPLENWDVGKITLFKDAHF
eukprot:1081928-Lingulodinium_polyedra.AAC.1